MLKDKITSDLKDSLKSGDVLRRSVLGMLKAAIGNKEIEKRKKEEGLSETEIQEVIRSEVKRRQDAVTAFRVAGREEQAQSEEAEAEILKAYLPPQASDGEIKTAVEKAMAMAGSKSKNDFGKIMGLAVKELAGRAEGGRIKWTLESMLE
ncbi:MAG: GatB/YqeY domain-containing protein [Parcubacteria group bacterium]|nr:GatB/YqeY domain-containing protein [Parcubacteria group bacterium]